MRRRDPEADRVCFGDESLHSDNDGLFPLQSLPSGPPKRPPAIPTTLDNDRGPQQGLSNRIFNSWHIFRKFNINQLSLG
jgi:hypothetical protein